MGTSSEVYSIIIGIGFGMAGVFLCVSIGMFFGMHIVRVWKDISGSLVRRMNGTAAMKQIEAVLAQGGNSLNRNADSLFDELAKKSMAEPASDKVGTISAMATRSLSGALLSATTNLAATVALGASAPPDGSAAFVIEKNISNVATNRSL